MKALILPLNLKLHVFAPEFADANSHSERRTHMPNIQPVSDLRSYNEVLRDIAVAPPCSSHKRSLIRRIFSIVYGP